MKIETKLITIYLTATVHSTIDEHLANYFRDGWEAGEIILETGVIQSGVAGRNSFCGWLVVKLTKPKVKRLTNSNKPVKPRTHSE